MSLLEVCAQYEKLATDEHKPEFHEYRGFTIKVFWDYKDDEWVAEKSRKGEKEGYMPSSGPSKDIAIARAKEGIDKVHKAILHGDR